MGLAERVLTREPAPEQRALQVTPWGDWGGGTYGSAAGMNVTTDSALQLLTVYGASALIADTIATLPRDVFRSSNGKNLEVPNRPRWLEQPNPTTDIVEFLTQSLLDLLLDGNAYWAYNVDLNFLPTTLTVISPTVMDVRDDDGKGPAYFVNGERFRGRLLHLKGLARSGSLKGLSPVEHARQSIGLGLAVQEFAGNFYKNGATLSAVVEVPGPMTQQQAKDLRENISRTHGGIANAHLPGVITNGGKWHQTSVTPEQAQFLESRKFQAGEICSQMFLLDPTMLGIGVNTGSSLTYANLEQRGIHLVQFTLMRWIIRLERAFSFLLPKPQFLKFNVNALQRADLKTRYEAHRIALGPDQPFEAVNEVRGFEDLPPMADFDKIAEPPAPVTPAPPAEPQVNHHHVNVEAAQVHVPQQLAPIVNVAAADPTPVHVNVEAAQHRIEVNPTPVQVNPTPVTVDVAPTPVEVNVAAAEAPEVNVTVEPTPVTIDVAPTPIEIAPAEVNVNIAPAENRIEVNPTPIEVHPTEVNVLPPEVTVESPIVNVHPPDIRVDAPVVHVRPSPIRIDAPVINMPQQGRIRRTFERDEDGITVAVIEEPIEEEPEAPTEGTEHESQ